ncbi:MAG: YjgN family protein [Defluviitaleaceae bacterium]|nr:YjgN family protein [Defluviitaleaceae bacterium]
MFKVSQASIDKLAKKERRRKGGGLLGKIMDFANKFYPGRQKNAGRKSRFEGFIGTIGREGDMGLIKAIGLCDEALDIVSDRIILMNRLRDVEEKMIEVEGYNSLDENAAEDLKDLLSRYASLSREARQLQYQTTSFDSNITGMERLEHEVPGAIPEIKFAEERQRVFKKDMGYLEGEKMVLEDDNLRMTNALDFVRKFSVGLTCFFGFLALLFAGLYVVLGTQSLIMLAVMIVFVVAISALVYSMRIRLRNELALNYRKQARATELLNKKTAVYAHFTNFLNYEYRKFKVRNAEMLKSNLAEYNNYKHLVKRLDSVRSIMGQTEVAIEFFLKDRNISLNFSSIEKFAQTVNIDDKKNFYREMSREKVTIERNLTELEQRHISVWGNIMDLQAADEGEEKVMDKLIGAYMEKVGNMMVYDNANDTDDDSDININQLLAQNA